jgi:ABC-type Mn2+/Zn2+ transport system ATPase subunit
MTPSKPFSANQPARLEFCNVTVSYDTVPVLRDVSFQVPHGSRVAVIGPNGAGKSTLFKALVGLLPLSSGQILIHGELWGSHTDCVAYIPQREEVDLHFPVTVRDVVAMGRYGKTGWFGASSAQDKAVVQSSLEVMSIVDLADRQLQDLSGGQQQRAFLARAIAQQPHILLMDEPFNGVDVITQQITLNLLDEMKKRDITVMVSTHDLNLAREKFDLVILLNQSLIAFGSPEQVFSSENIKSAFADHMMIVAGALVVDDCCGGHDHDHSVEGEGQL